ncbi:c-type cytochrome [Paraburkholderia fungorum]
MPAFAAELPDAQIAVLTNYVATRFGNPAFKVTEHDVAELR